MRIGGTRHYQCLGVSNNDRKYYSIDRAREVLDYDPVDNSADYHEDGTPRNPAAE